MTPTENSSCCHLTMWFCFVFLKLIFPSLAEVGRKGVDFEERCSCGTWNGPCSYNSIVRLWKLTSPPCNNYKFSQFSLYLLSPTAQTIQNIQSSNSLVPFLVLQPEKAWTRKPLKPFHRIMSYVASCGWGPVIKLLTSHPARRCSKFLPPVAAHFRCTGATGSMPEWMVECYERYARLENLGAL